MYKKLRKNKKRIFDAEAVLDIGKRHIQANAYGLKRMNTGMMAILTAGEGRDYVGKSCSTDNRQDFLLNYIINMTVHKVRIISLKRHLN